MAVVASETFTSTSAPIQYAAIRAYEGGSEIGRYLQLSRRILRSLGKHCTKQLASAGIESTPPRGAFYLFLDFTTHADELMKRGVITGKDLCQQLLEDTGVALLPGSDFGRPDEELTARLSYVDFDGAQALAAAGERPKDRALNGEFVRTHCSKVVEGIDRIRVWTS
jgi:aspartate aminotransferase